MHKTKYKMSQKRSTLPKLLLKCAYESTRLSFLIHKSFFTSYI